MRHSVWLLAVSFSLPLLLACSGPTKPAPLKTAQLPANNTPEGAVLRFMALYSGKNAVEYAKLFTGDFGFEFSNAADPTLVQRYLSGWGKADEVIAATNFFFGGTNSDGQFSPAAATIEVELLPTMPNGDNTAGRDPNLYKVLLAAINVRADVRDRDIIYVIGEAPPQNNRFFLVRGDVAIGLDADQPADADHWYIWHWRDESPQLNAPTPSDTFGTQQNESSTWGRVKSFYR